MKRKLGESMNVLLIAMLFISMLMVLPIFPAAATTPLPKLEARPAVIEAEMGADVAIEIWATNVAADWEIIGFQLSVPYENDLLQPISFDVGDFMEAFVNGGETGPLYATSNIPRAPNWDVTMAMVMILSDPNAMSEEDLYHAPFPSGEGRLMTLHYTVLEAVEGVPVDIIDILILDRYLGEVPYEPLIISANVDIVPNTLNLKSRGRWITAYIEFLDGHDVNNIDVSSIRLNGTIPVDTEAPMAIGDCDSDGVLDLMVGFDRTAVSELILSKGIKYGKVTLTLGGQLIYGATFEGNDAIRVRMPGDINVDGTVNMRDLSLAGKSFGSCPEDPRWNYVADENEDSKIDMRDLGIIARNFGQSY